MSSRPHIPPGIYLNLSESEYHAAEGLSNSGMKQLAISPLHYWHCNLNPHREREETAAQRWGKAVHCRLLEPKRFELAYGTALSKDDYPDALVTVDDLKTFLKDNGLSATAKSKPELIDRVQESGLRPFIWDVEKEQHDAQLVGRSVLSAREMHKLEDMAEVVLDDAGVAQALLGGHSELSIFVRDPDTDVMLKARLDKLQAWGTVDLKTFSNSRGKPTDKVVNEAIYYEGYYQQAVFYRRMREMARQLLAVGKIELHDAPDGWADQFIANDRHGFAFVFVESSEPFDMRVVELQREEYPDADANAYWTDAEIRIEELTTLYAKCVKRYGSKPWRDPVRPRTLQDTDIPQLLFAGSAV